ncbi:DUF3152 domain-containing protein [Streptomyces sp. NBC_01408]|uniref:DUF3152 domain-containing protein n=1 Tax=Streptomyces sp. NBC_01408 TaxID=2903855 RepID=UPI002254B400|nr:DUF3152 domain-containing protein [Streptomyces sp. NBC_01408]MCX4691160.1 DUF3152 domain-containing protein [Streptomyces sp. NBC_01408]
MGRHSRKAPPASAAPAPAPAEPAPLPYEDPPARYEPWPDPYEEPGSLFGGPASPYGEPLGRGHAEPTVTHQGYVPQAHPWPEERPGGHPEQYERYEPGGVRGAGPGYGSTSGSVYGDWQGVPRDGTPAAVAADAARFPAAPAAPSVPAPDALTSTGSHRRVPGPRKPVQAAPAAGFADAVPPAEERSGSPRGAKVRTYGGMAAAAVTTVLAVVVAVQVASESDIGKAGALASPDDGRARAGDGAASRSDGRPTPDAAASPSAEPSAAPPAPELTYEQKMAQQLPFDAKLTGPGTFDTVPGVAKAPGKGKVVRYRVDVEQGLGLDPQLFAEAVHRTLNDPRSWGHGGSRTFERVPGGEADFVITLASPGTTGTWCAKSGLDTTVDNVSCDSAATDRVMINAFRWAQGSPTFGPDQMFAYRQMLINHEVGHRLGHGHVSCRTPGSLAPIMQQQTKSLDVDGIRCKPNPWAFPGN